MITAIVRSQTVPAIDGMEFQLTVKLPYITVVAPDQHQLLYRVYATSTKEGDKLVYSEVEPLGFKVK